MGYLLIRLTRTREARKVTAKNHTTTAERLRRQAPTMSKFGSPAAIGRPLDRKLCVPDFHQVCPYRALEARIHYKQIK